ncbi:MULTISPECIES: haloacid dehalogenase type II [Methylobacterium]|uniref:(S)-2-haloacid dehalogenase n=2 Tax=Pseudomonadota TaxID=1224 RepID=A0ABQ4SZZ4_9HYPH|nr:MULTISPECIES: haloacid dehalogenase type II [Methylobacterium]PIU06759.1 MAG: haloacid dehalogenase type II [Methylobacterium sp. CG09_land_8_20_14_0_10_71_15]PIU14863.1 MAG: haloacid dehalogenase type II [Methylobacterium sp. CG08_land_8_20_14_0_20_71_15]GBU17981.1 haloacid dehalogenase [Methylobacterium sp.]GJE07448.1 (S)-2-haloacid dehalogenase 4A [Methylobacterium jeotgali]
MRHDILAHARAVVFDAYGTLFDVHSAVARHAGAVGPEARALSDLWRGKQLEYTWVYALTGRHPPFWTLTERALDFALARHPRIDRALREQLLDAYRDLDAYPEAKRVLAALKARGLSTAILSNGDPAMLARAVASAGIELDAVLSVAAAGAYKTHPRAYALVEERLGVPPEAVVFCSSNRWDVAGAAAFGFAAVWVNRTGLPDEYPDLPPTQVVASLDALV